jgi:hypothetical protein
MAAPKEVKKEVKADKPKMQFAFDQKNYMILIAGIALLIIGFILLSGGGSNDPNQFSDELFSKRRMVVAPIILMLGYIVVGVAIMKKRDEHTVSDENQE